MLTILGSLLAAEEKSYWIFLEVDPFAPTVQLTNRGTQRLQEKGLHDATGNHAVSPSQLSQLREAGFQIRHASRFLNAVSVSIETRSQLSALSSFNFVKSIRPVAHRPQKRFNNNTGRLKRDSDPLYSQSSGQNEMLNIPAIHNQGYDGSGVLVGVFDTGFLTDHEVFSSMDIEAQYDFIDHEPDASGLGHEHGINVLSVLAGYYPGKLIGPAHGASYLLARTEDNYSESRAEEDNWVAALEWADSLGVDIISSSLNYFQDFDDPAEDYPISALDGQTTIVARAANIAAARGILVVNSAGNEGPAASSLWPPADSPNVLAVGAVNDQESISYFSGRGPTYDGRTKPDVVAQGSTVFMATGVNGYTYGNGTSFSAPQIAGLAALLLQAHPQLKPDSIIAIFRSYGDHSGSPDNTYGWGIPDLTSLFQDIRTTGARNCLVYPNPGGLGDYRMVIPDPITVVPEHAMLYDIRGRVLIKPEAQLEADSIIRISIPEGIDLASQLLILHVQAGDKTYAGKFIYLRP